MEFKPYQTYIDHKSSGSDPDFKADGRYASGAFTVLSVGPSRLLDGRLVGVVTSAAGEKIGALTVPIGLVQQASLQHSRQFNRIFELGSERSYFVSGRTQGQLSIARTYYHGKSLLRAMAQAIPGASTENLSTQAAAVFLADNYHPTKIYPGFKDLWLNLASDLFSQPIGLMLKVYDTNEAAIGATYLEGCYIPNHTFSTDSNGLLIQEQASVMFERAVAVASNAQDLVTYGVQQLSTAASQATTGS